MKKSKLNLVIDAIMLVVMMALIGVGLLNKYVLLSGQEKWAKFGKNLDLTLFGLDRHEWNTIHFILGILLFALLLLHIWFHWNMVVHIYQNIIKNRKVRIVLAIALLAVSVVLIAFPLFINAEIENHDYQGERHYSGRNKDAKERDGQYLQKTESTNIENPVIDSDKNTQLGNIEIKNNQEKINSPKHVTDVKKEEHHNIPANIEVMGSMTLKFVAEKYDVPVNLIKSKLNIPQSTSNYEKLGRLRRVHGFTMSEVEEIIYSFQKENLIDKKN